MTAAAVGLSTLAAYALSTVVGSTGAPAFTARVVSTYPAENAEIAAGKLKLRVTFSQQMRPDSYSFVMQRQDTYPRCSGTPLQSADGRTFTLECVVEPHRTYEIGFNSARFRNFVTEANGAPAAPTVLRFSTR